MTFLAGAAEVVITPPIGTLLDGYGAPRRRLHRRTRRSPRAGARPRRWATRAAIVSCDLIGVDRRLVAAVAMSRAAATGIPAANIMVAATHTHAGPAGLRSDLNPALSEVTARLIAGAIDRRAPQAGAGGTQGRPRQRRLGEPESPRSGRPAPTMRCASCCSTAPDPRDTPIASVVNFACHATVLYSHEHADQRRLPRRAPSRPCARSPAMRRASSSTAPAAT